MQNQKIFELTGTPFVDAGIATLCVLCDKKSPEDLTYEDLLLASERAAEIYLTQNWKKSLYSVFPNSLLTNPSSQKSGNIKVRYLHFLRALIKTSEHHSGEKVCISCGRRTVEIPKIRMDIPLLGSGDIINFFPSGQRGADYCNVCTFAVQFFPLSMRKGVKLFSIHSLSLEILKSWARPSLKLIEQELLMGNLQGPLTAKSNSPMNALFEFSSEILTELEERSDLEEISGAGVDLLQFTNFQQGANLRIYGLPSRIFRFLYNIRYDTSNQNDWRNIVNRNYKRKKNSVEIDYNELNGVYDSLLNGKPLTPFFLDRKNKVNICSWKFVKFYLEEIRKMEKERIEKIRQVADNIGSYLLEQGSVKLLYRFENCKSYAEFRNQLRKIQKDWALNIRDGVPFTFDDYVNYLFPESAIDWKDTRDLMLFRIYEKMGTSSIKEQLIEMEKTDEMKEED